MREEAQEEWMLAERTTPGSKSIRVLRPLRDVGMKECGVWVWWRGLHVVGRDPYWSAKHGIGALTRGRCICGLLNGSCSVGYLQTLLLGWKQIIRPLYPPLQVHVPKWSRRRNQMQSV